MGGGADSGSTATMWGSRKCEGCRTGEVRDSDPVARWIAESLDGLVETGIVPPEDADEARRENLAPTRST